MGSCARARLPARASLPIEKSLMFYSLCAMAVTLNQLSELPRRRARGLRVGGGREALRDAAFDLGRGVGAVARARRRPDRARRARGRADRRRRRVPAVRRRRARADRAGEEGGARGGRRLDALAADRRGRDGGGVRRARRCCARSRERTPRSTSTLEVANRASLFDRVLEHEVDVAIAGRPPEDERIAGQAFLENEIALIAAPGDDAGRATRAVRPEELAGRVWLMRETGLGHAAARLGVPRRPRPAAADADARLERGDQGGGAARARGVARSRASRSSTSSRPARSPRSACAGDCRGGSGTRCTRRPCRRGPRSSSSSRSPTGPRRARAFEGRE